MCKSWLGQKWLVVGQRQFFKEQKLEWESFFFRTVVTMLTEARMWTLLFLNGNFVKSHSDIWQQTRVEWHQKLTIPQSSIYSTSTPAFSCSLGVLWLKKKSPTLCPINSLSRTIVGYSVTPSFSHGTLTARKVSVDQMWNNWTLKSRNKVTFHIDWWRGRQCLQRWGGLVEK